MVITCWFVKKKPMFDFQEPILSPMYPVFQYISTIPLEKPTGTMRYGRCAVNINGRDVQRKNVVNYVDKSSLRAP